MNKLILFSVLVATFTASLALPIPQHAERYDVDYDRLEPKILNLKSSNVPTAASKSHASYPDFRPYGREEAELETEHWLSKKDSIYNRAQNAAARFLMPKPIVDTIQEHEKYGNDGETYRNIGRALIKGYDAIGRIGNTVVELPFKTKDGISKTINAALNAIGGKLVGL